MRYLSIALSVEGPTDRAFLWPIVHRTALSLASNAVVQETAYFIERGTNQQRIKAICKEATDFDIFVVHADATRTALPRVKNTIIDAIREGVNKECQLDQGRVVGLLTVSEMESWALASPLAIAESLGFGSWPNRLPMHWNPASVEILGDPKQALEMAFEGLLQRPLDQVLLYETLEALGSRISLDDLAALPSYREFRDQLRTCLVALRAAE